MHIPDGGGVLIQVVAAAISTARLVLPAQFPAGDFRADVLLLAISGQEMSWTFRTQDGGPATSYWSMQEQTVADVMVNPATTALAQEACQALDVPFDMAVVFNAIQWCDPLAACIARLILWADPSPLPAVGDQAGAWACYLRNWRPGTPRPDAWSDVYEQAVAIA